MAQFIQDYLAEIVVSLLSLVAVGISLFRAQAQETEAAANAVNELAESSQDLRERVHKLEETNTTKDAEITLLRQKSAQIPMLEAQVTALTEELARMRGAQMRAIEGGNAREGGDL